MKDSDAVELVLLYSIGSQLESLKEQIEDTDYHEYLALDDEVCALIDAVYASVEDSRNKILCYITNTGLDDTFMNAIEGKHED